jgi:glutamate N-acetyltransferase/amino-acid N-acetyltransferase
MTQPIAGFRFSAVSAGIRKDGRVDVALAAAERPVTAAGLFTRNLVRAAPVVVAEQRVGGGRARAVLVNAGCANACTGEPGRRATLETTRGIALALGAAEAEILPASTGVIGVVLPADKILAKVGELVERLSPDGVDDFALAICTTDRWPKVAEATLPNGARVLGIGKGAGMIHPDVGPPQATMLVFLFTDAVVTQAELSRALFAAADRTFNAITVDGDTSTNDSVFAFASGASGLTVSASELTPALTEVCGSLARSMVRDGEGAEHVIEIKVSGLSTEEEARTTARTVATSLLVKTALFGNDANWGRLLAAAGRSGVRFDPSRARITIADVEIVRDGLGVGGEAEAEAQRRMAAREAYTVELTLGEGPGSFSYFTSDLGHGYVDVNAGYRS